MSQYVEVNLESEPEGRVATHGHGGNSGSGAVRVAPVGRSYVWVPWSQIEDNGDLDGVEKGTVDRIYVAKWFCDKNLIPYKE